MSKVSRAYYTLRQTPRRSVAFSMVILAAIVFSPYCHIRGSFFGQIDKMVYGWFWLPLGWAMFPYNEHYFLPWCAVPLTGIGISLLVLKKYYSSSIVFFLAILCLFLFWATLGLLRSYKYIGSYVHMLMLLYLYTMSVRKHAFAKYESKGVDSNDVPI